MLDKLNERIKDRDVSLGVIMIVAGIFVTMLYFLVIRLGVVFGG